MVRQAPAWSPVLVTGAAGYIGGHAVLALRDAGYPVVALDDLSAGRRDALADGVPFVQGSVGDADLVRSLLAEHGIGAVLHFAGSIVNAESLARPLHYYGNNSCAARSLIEACAEAGIERFVFSSTAAVYGDPARLVLGSSPRISEDAPTAPITPYGGSKLITEWILRDLAKVSDLRYVALRYFNVAGADPKGRAGQASRRATHLIEIASQAAAGQRDGVEIFGDDYPTPDGTCIRDYIHVSDLVEAHLRALRHLEKGGETLTLNLGNGEGFSVRTVIEAVKQVTGRDFPVRIGPRRPGDAPRLVADATRAGQLLGWAPQRPALETQIADAWRWHLSRLPAVSR